MDCYAVPPPDYKAGSDSKRDERCQQGPSQCTITATGASSRSGRPQAIAAVSSSRRSAATKDPFNAGEGKVVLQRNTDGERYIRKFDDPEKLQASKPGGMRILHDGVAQHYVQNLRRTTQIFVIFRSTQRYGTRSRATPYGLHFG